MQQKGDSTRADHVGRAATAFRSLVLDRFGPRFERHGDTGGLDAGVAMLLPPFADGAGVPAAVRDGWRGYQEAARRPGGGLAPGADWKQDGVSWTPETALVAYTAAMDGDRRTARDWARLGRVAGDARGGACRRRSFPTGAPPGRRRSPGPRHSSCSRSTPCQEAEPAGSTSSTRTPPASFGWMKLTRLSLVPRPRGVVEQAQTTVAQGRTDGVEVGDPVGELLDARSAATQELRDRRLG